MPNSQVRFPYGDAFLVNTPNIDNLGKAIYQQEQQRKAYQQQQDKMLDDEFARNLTGIRDSDIPDLTKAYGDFKQARMQTLNKPNISPDQQMDVLRKKAGVYDIINQSKTQREWEQAQGKQIMQDKKGIYADDAHQQLIQRMKTPVGKIDPNNDSKLLYPYSMPDLSKELDHARGKGTEKDVTVTIGQNPNDKFKDDKEIYKVGNNPTQFFNGLSQGITASNKARNFVGIVNQKYTDEEKQQLEDKYWARVSDPKFIQVYGKPELFPEYANNTDLGRAAKIETMEEFVNKPFAPSRKVSEINQERKTADAHQFAIDQQRRGNANTVGHIRLAAGLRKDAKSDGAVESADAVLHNVFDIFNEGEKDLSNDGKPITNKVKAQMAQSGEFVISDPNLLKTFSGIKKIGSTPVPPDKVTVNKNKDQINFIYNEIPAYKDEKGNNIPAVPESSISMSGRDYAKMKVKETYPNKDVGDINNIVDKVVTKNGGLYKTIQMYNTNAGGKDEDVIKVSINGKVMQGRRGDLKKLDNQGIQYKVVE